MSSVRLLLVLVFVATLFSATNVVAQGDSVPPTLIALQEQIESNTQQLRLLSEQLGQAESTSDAAFGLFPDPGDDGCTPGSLLRVPLTMEQAVDLDCDQAPSSAKTHHRLDFYGDYDKGFVIEPFDQSEHPFRLRISSWVQFRHSGFGRDVDTWADNAGTVRDVRTRNVFDIERARLVFSGMAIDERFNYFLQIDGDSDGSHIADFMDYWIGWKFSDSFRLQMGKRKIPGSRQWLLSARRTRFSDRPMANDFFRPDRTIGIYGIGTIGERGHYQLMVGDSFHRPNARINQRDDRFTFAATSYFDPWGNYGSQIVDFDCSGSPLLRVGHSITYSSQESDRLGTALDEATFLRLSDGTVLTQTGALATGVTVSEYDILLYGIDIAWKYQGWSFNSEVFLRWVDNLRGDGALAISHLDQRGLYVEGGRFLIPKTLDLNGRYSQVSGEFGTGTEYAIGFSWFPAHKPQLKFSFDVTALDSSPLQGTPSDILAGDDGILYRTQLQADY
ncbi:porin [Rhodopirellula sp. MGV]|uniref:porin n=1 Tax=Rhodopirellula sp. MGV TaxID=2023130 RepID=UPI000B96F986|nr:porin [Rhodopirellula sp. MGV]OYP30488.1 porin [Rhodopirellula sp. MGV]PNY35203.1 porin [Rhodopirellula baltica]